MNIETIFTIANIYVLPFWLSMLIAPRASVTRKLNNGFWQILPLAAVYALLIIPDIGTILPAVANPHLDSIVQLLANREGIVLVWLHILAWDLFVGRFLWLDTLKRERPLWKLRIALFFTLMTGPFGLLLYFALDGRRPAEEAQEKV